MHVKKNYYFFFSISKFNSDTKAKNNVSDIVVIVINLALALYTSEES